MKVVYDTCLYVDLLRDAKHLDLFQHRGHIRYLSPVVIMELNAGVRSTKQQSTLDRLYAPYSKAGRIAPVGNEEFYLAGKLLAKLRGHRDPRGIAHDILIAVGAYTMGAWLFTSNKSDFEVINRHLRFKVEYL